MKLLGALAIAALVSLAPVAAQTPMKKVTIGGTLSATDIGLWVAHKKGYFRDEGIDAQFVVFDSAARMIAALGTGDLDVSAGGHSAGLFNAVARGIGERTPPVARRRHRGNLPHSARRTERTVAPDAACCRLKRPRPPHTPDI